MPKEMMGLIENLKPMISQLKFGGCIDWEYGGKNLRVFVCNKALLPEGEPTYEYAECIDKWYKKVIVNGISYELQLTQEEYEAEVA